MTGIPMPGPWHGESTKPKPYLGDRSTRDGGYWELAREPQRGICQVQNEIWKIVDSVENEEEQMLLSSRLKHMMDDALEGKLRFGESEDVHVITRVPDLLELRIQIYPDLVEDPRRQILRLYFAEPPQHARLMLALKFSRKPKKDDPGGMQDRHINDARYRYEEGWSADYTWGVELTC